NPEDVAIFRLIDRSNVGQHVAYPKFLCAMPLEEAGEFPGIEMIGVVRDGFELWGRDCLGRQSLVAYPPLGADRVAEALRALAPEPVRHEVHSGKCLRKHQRMIVAVARLAGGPACEIGALLEGAAAFAEELGLRNADLCERRAQGRPGTFADT